MSSGDYIDANQIPALRSYGYTLQTSIADIVDNSIDAKASWIQISFHRNSESKLNGAFFLDNGNGMDEKTLYDAMCFGISENNATNIDDRLGKFGSGLKTASWAHAKTLIVATKQNNKLVGGLKWDLDRQFKANGVGQLVSQLEPASPNDLSWHFIEKYLMPLEHGTIVIWENIDRVINEQYLPADDRYKYWMRMNEIMQNHLGMVFNKIISRDKNPIKIYSGTRIPNDPDRFLTEAWTPSCKDLEGVEKIIDEKIIINNHNPIIVRGYLLPKYDSLSKTDREYLEGPEGMNGHQGFTVYRNQRVLVSGDWLTLEHNNRLIKRSARYNRIRIILDLPQSMDNYWNLDVKKTSILPPVESRKALEKIFARMLTELEKTSLRKRGTNRNILKNENFISPWVINKNKELDAKLDIKHEIFQNLLKFNNLKEDILADLIDEIESSFPFTKLFDYFSSSQNKDDKQSQEELNNIKKLRKVMLDQNKTLNEIKISILQIPNYRKYIDKIIAMDETNEL